MRRFALIFLACIALAVQPVWAEELVIPATPSFDPNYILDDVELTDSGSLSLTAIQNFLASAGGTLGSYRTTDVDGVIRSAAEIIYGASQRASINPKFLIVLLQKEQSLVQDPSPTQRQYDWATGFGVCDSCDTNDPALQQFRGFAAQVDRAASRQRYYLTHPNEFAIRINQPYVIDQTTVVPVSQATANLYIYTPHLSGNQSFWSLWQRYFARHYPDGSLLVDQATDEYWLLQYGQRRKFESRSTLFADYDIKRAIKVAHTDLQRYDVGTPIQFPQYSLLKSPRGTIYLLVDDMRRGFASREAFRVLGYNPDEVIPATWDDLRAYPEGPPITTDAASPTGQLLQDKKSGAVFYVVNGVRQPIIGRNILKSRFPFDRILPVSNVELERYPLGSPVAFRDGALLTSSTQSTVYVIANGQKRPIASADVFNGLGYQWSNIVRVDDRELGVNPDGAVLTL